MNIVIINIKNVDILKKCLNHIEFKWFENSYKISPTEHDGKLSIFIKNDTIFSYNPYGNYKSYLDDFFGNYDIISYDKLIRKYKMKKLL